MTTLDRYLLKEILLTCSAVLAVVLVAVLSYRLADYLNKAAGGALVQDVILLLLGLQAIRTLVILVPPALLLGIVLALGRLHRDREMTALNACGAGPGTLYRPVLLIAVPMALIMAWLTLYLVPLAARLQLELQTQARQEAAITLFKPGVFRELADGRHVIYIGAADPDKGELRDIFVRSLEGEDTAITTAERGYQHIDPQTAARYLVLQNGHRYQGSPGQSEFYNLRFERLAVQVDSGPSEEVWMKRQAIPTALIWGTDNRYYLSELHERFSGPIALLLLAFLAPLIAHAQPREGRYGRVVVAVLIYAVYGNLLQVGRAWLAAGTLWPGAGLWWIHGLLALAILGLWIYHYGLPGRSQ